MARQLRIEYPGAIYHITSRGNARQSIVEDNEDRELFLRVLELVTDKYNLLCHAYCLMDNHYHLLVETPDGNLSLAMRHLNGIYTQRLNRRHGRVGHLFQGRFKAILVERDSYLLELCRYVVLNPVRAGMVESPEHYIWSSYRATAGSSTCPKFLSIAWLLEQFGRRRKTAQKKYAAFVAAGMEAPSPWDELKSQVLLGSERFVTELQPCLKSTQTINEIPRTQRFVNRPRLVVLFESKDSWSREKRNEVIREAHEEHGYTLTEIGRAVGLHYTTISKIVNSV